MAHAEVDRPLRRHAPVGLSAAILLALVATLCFGGCRSAHISPATIEKANRNPPAAPGVLPAMPVVGPVDYRIGPLDVLEVEVFGAPALSRTVRISAGGEFSMPLIGRVMAAGLSVGELEAVIARHLEDGYLEEPQVSVFVTEYMSQRVTVEGAVREPGIHALTGRTSLLQVIALSNGLDELANPRGIVIYRNIDGQRYAAAFDIREIRAGRQVDPEVLGDDLVVVDYSGARSNLRDFLMSVPALALFLLI
jgi:polysaccharide biosynthesis/export protein